MWSSQSDSKNTRTMIKRPRDTNQLAKLMIDIATGQVKDEPPELAAQAIGGHAGRRA